MFLLANVVDDVAMGITHVIRGEEHVNGTPKYLLLATALGYDYRPAFAHLPLLVNEQRKKLSKRRDDVAVGDYRDRGFLPEAMRNYLALLGWGPDDGVEVRPIGEIVDKFRLGRRHPVAGVLRHQEAAARSMPSGSGRSTWTSSCGGPSRSSPPASRRVRRWSPWRPRCEIGSAHSPRSAR